MSWKSLVLLGKWVCQDTTWMILTQDLELKLQVLLQQRQYGITAVQTVYWQQYRQYSLQDSEISAYVDESLRNIHTCTYVYTCFICKVTQWKIPNWWKQLIYYNRWINEHVKLTAWKNSRFETLEKIADLKRLSTYADMLKYKSIKCLLENSTKGCIIKLSN